MPTKYIKQSLFLVSLLFLLLLSFGCNGSSSEVNDETSMETRDLQNKYDTAITKGRWYNRQMTGNENNIDVVQKYTFFNNGTLSGSVMVIYSKDTLVDEYVSGNWNLIYLSEKSYPAMHVKTKGKTQNYDAYCRFVDVNDSVLTMESPVNLINGITTFHKIR